MCFNKSEKKIPIDSKSIKLNSEIGSFDFKKSSLYIKRLNKNGKKKN